MCYQWLIVNLLSSNSAPDEDGEPAAGPSGSSPAAQSSSSSLKTEPSVKETPIPSTSMSNGGFNTSPNISSPTSGTPTEQELRQRRLLRFGNQNQTEAAANGE